MQVNNSAYRKLGGWLMFINVITILNLVSSGWSVLSGTVNLARTYGSGGYYPDSFNAYYYYSAITIFSLVISVLALAASICILVFLHRRKKRPFAAFFFIHQGLGVVSLLGTTLYYMQYPIFDYFKDLLYGLYEYDTTLTQREISELVDTLSYTFQSFLLGALYISLFLSLAFIVMWAVYLVRSKRVKVYFDPHYVEHPMPVWGGIPAAPVGWYTAPPPPVYGYQPFPGYPVPPQPYSPAGYPAPPQSYPLPPQAPYPGYPPAAPQTPAPQPSVPSAPSAPVQAPKAHIPPHPPT